MLLPIPERSRLTALAKKTPPACVKTSMRWSCLGELYEALPKLDVVALHRCTTSSIYLPFVQPPVTICTEKEKQQASVRKSPPTICRGYFRNLHDPIVSAYTFSTYTTHFLLLFFFCDCTHNLPNLICRGRLRNPHDPICRGYLYHLHDLPLPFVGVSSATSTIPLPHLSQSHVPNLPPPFVPIAYATPPPPSFCHDCTPSLSTIIPPSHTSPSSPLTSPPPILGL